jgi:uncharacterized protein
MSGIIVDAGPLVAYLDRSDRDHGWAKGCFMQITSPLLTCEAVIAEALFLLRRGGIDVSGQQNPTIQRGAGVLRMTHHVIHHRIHSDPHRQI